MIFSSFLNENFISAARYKKNDIKRNKTMLLHTGEISEVLPTIKITLEYIYSMTILKKMNVSFIIHYFLGKYSFSHDIF